MGIKRTAGLTALVCATALAVAGCGGSSGKRAERAATAPAPTSAAPSPSDPGGTVASSAEPASAGPGVVPDVVGQRLPDGEAILRGHGFLSINRVDVTGQGRTVLEPKNWVIRSQDPPGGVAATPGLTVSLGVAKPTDTVPSTAVVKGVVPDVRCKDLQSAQDALRAAGFYLLVPKDGLGQGRVPIADRNWIVVGQSAAPGSTPSPKSSIQLTVVKYGEPTGASGCQS